MGCVHLIADITSLYVGDAPRLGVTPSAPCAVVKWAGAADLWYLGVRTLLVLWSPDAEASPRSHGGFRSRQGELSPEERGFLYQPHPQLVSPGPTATLESVLLAVIFIGLELVWLSINALLAEVPPPDTCGGHSGSKA